MTMSPTTFLSEVLGSDPIAAGKVAYFRGRLSNELHQAVLNRFMQLERESGFSRADLGRRIGRKPEQITRWLGSPGNWTLETLSDMTLAMGCELEPHLAEISRHLTPAQQPQCPQRPEFRAVRSVSIEEDSMLSNNEMVFILKHDEIGRLALEIDLLRLLREHLSSAVRIATTIGPSVLLSNQNNGVPPKNGVNPHDSDIIRWVLQRAQCDKLHFALLKAYASHQSQPIRPPKPRVARRAGDK